MIELTKPLSIFINKPLKNFQVKSPNSFSTELLVSWELCDSCDASILGKKSI